MANSPTPRVFCDFRQPNERTEVASELEACAGVLKREDSDGRLKS